jgi:hypothetical protein
VVKRVAFLLTVLSFGYHDGGVWKTGVNHSVDSNLYQNQHQNVVVEGLRTHQNEQQITFAASPAVGDDNDHEPDDGDYDDDGVEGIQKKEEVPLEGRQEPVEKGEARLGAQTHVQQPQVSITEVEYYSTSHNG